MSNSTEHKLDQLRPYIVAIMQEQGRDFTVCGYKDCDIPEGEYEIHHTKYRGATFYDLIIVCRSCNRIAENVGLK